jgi:predicted O-methyltransferase YrrM
MSLVEEAFHRNVKKSQKSIRVMKGDSIDRLSELIKMNEMFDFIYVDGSHMMLDCYADLVLSWQLLNPGGVLAIDDYPYIIENDIFQSPFEAVNHFLEKYNGKYKMISKTYRVFLEKY